jgi:phosphoribosylglycinamide formyltransferase-1
MVSGCTVHFANENYDEGPIVVQKSVSLTDDDTPDDIATKVFAAECQAFPQAVNKVCEMGIDYFWQREAERFDYAQRTSDRAERR